MSTVVKKQVIAHKKNPSSTIPKAYPFNKALAKKTIDQSSSKISLNDMKMLPTSLKQKGIFSYKEFEPKNYSTLTLSQSKSTRSVSTGITTNNDLTQRSHRQIKRTSSSYYDVNKKVTPSIILETKSDINSRLNTVSGWLDYIDTEGFKKYKNNITKRKHTKSAYEISNHIFNSTIKAFRKDENDAIVNNGKLYTECSINKQRAISNSKQRINPNQIKCIKIDIPQYDPKIHQLKIEKDTIEKERRELIKDTAEMTSKIKTYTMCISDLQKDNDRIKEQIHFIHKQIKPLKDKIQFYFDSNQKSMLNVKRLINDKSLFLIK